jgi:hypothetical protein
VQRGLINLNAQLRTEHIEKRVDVDDKNRTVRARLCMNESWRMFVYVHRCACGSFEWPASSSKSGTRFRPPDESDFHLLHHANISSLKKSCFASYLGPTTTPVRPPARAQYLWMLANGKPASRNGRYCPRVGDDWLVFSSMRSECWIMLPDLAALHRLAK